MEGATTFSGKKTGVQTRLKKHAPYSVFFHYYCPLLQLACMQAANSTTGVCEVQGENLVNIAYFMWLLWLFIVAWVSDCGLLYHVESVPVVMWRREKVTGWGGTGSELVLPYIVMIGKGSLSINILSVHYFAVFWWVCLSSLSCIRLIVANT